MSDFVPVLKFVRLPDGRWGMENGEGVADVTREDIAQMHDAWMLWAGIRWDRAADKEVEATSNDQSGEE